MSVPPWPVVRLAICAVRCGWNRADDANRRKPLETNQLKMCVNYCGLGVWVGSGLNRHQTAANEFALLFVPVPSVSFVVNNYSPSLVAVSDSCLLAASPSSSILGAR
jgi:hypothetical protein